MTDEVRDQALLHPDFLRLEQELGDRIAAVVESAGQRVPRILVLAPATRQVRRVREALSGRFPALLGVEVMTHLAFARRRAETATADTPQLMDRSLRLALVERVLAAETTRPLGRYAAEFPTVIPSLAGLLGELREAGVTARALQDAAGSKRETDLARLLDEYEKAVVILESGEAGPPRSDRAGITALAATLAPERTYDLLVSYGAYELVGMNLTLMRSIPCRERLWLVPADAEAPSWRFARDFLERYVEAAPTSLDDDEVRPFVRAARAFRNREVPGGLLPPKAVDLVHVQGPEAELTHVARAVLSDLALGAEPTDIGIVARTLEPYASALESVFEQHGIPIDAGTGFPASRHPGVLAVITLLRTLAEGFPRQPVMDLLRSPFLRRGDDVEHWAPNLWDRLSRVYSISQGAESWTRVLPQMVAAEELRGESPGPDAMERFQRGKEQRIASVNVLAAVLTGLAGSGAEWAKCRRGSEHETFIRTLLHDTLRLRKDDDSHAAVEAALTALGSLDAAATAANRVTGGASETNLTPKNALDFLERTFTETPLAWSRPGGVPLLDVMQARGLTFKKLYLIGFNADLVPRRPRENVFLSDATRRALCEAGHPVRVSTESPAEEHLLLAQTAAAVRDHLTISWQRADAEGKSMAVSLSLQEWSRVMDGGLSLRDRLDAAPDRGGPWRLPTHPADAVRALVQRNRLASRLEGGLLLAHEADRDAPGAMERYVDRLGLGLEPLRPGLAQVAALERFEPGDGAYDAVVPAHAWDGVFSPSSMETLGGCPLQFYFKKVLRIRPLDDVPDAHEIDPMDMGTRIHRILELVYQPLVGLDPADTPLERLLAVAREHMDPAWNETVEPIRTRMTKRFPALWEATESVWRAELEAFVAKDLARLHADGWTVDSVEPPRSAEFAVRPGADGTDAVRIRVEGRLDRLCRGPERYLVSDYKTGGNLDRWVDFDKILPGIKLQLPLYTRILQTRFPEATVTAELLGLGPSFLPDRGFARADAVVLPDLNEDQEEGLWETLELLVRQTRGGSYPLHKDGPCDYCDFRDACRRRHIPSVERLKAMDANRDYYDSRDKKSTKPTLAAVRES